MGRKWEGWCTAEVRLMNLFHHSVTGIWENKSRHGYLRAPSCDDKHMMCYSNTPYPSAALVQPAAPHGTYWEPLITGQGLLPREVTLTLSDASINIERNFNSCKIRRRLCLSTECMLVHVLECTCKAVLLLQAGRRGGWCLGGSGSCGALSLKEAAVQLRLTRLAESHQSDWGWWGVGWLRGRSL